MIIEELIKIFVTSRNINYLIDKGYDAKYKEFLTINSKDLMSNSKYEILVMCDCCKTENRIMMKSYSKNMKKYNYYTCKNCSLEKVKNTNLKKYGVEQTFQNKDFLEKRVRNNIEKYGVSCLFELEEIKSKIKITNLSKYGFEHASQNDIIKQKMKKTRIEKKLQLPDEMIDDFILYKRKVDGITKISKKVLLNSWNGYDYYDNEYIKNNFELNGQNPNYPSIDHKTSVFYGYQNNIPPEIIGNIDNLCFTKNYINSLKNIKIEEDFKNFLKNKKAKE